MKLLLIYQPTAEGHAALAAARAEARMRGAKVIVVRHVKRSASQPVPDVGSRSSQTAGDPVRDSASRQDLGTLRAEMDSVEQGLRGDGIEADALLLTEGSDAADAFLEVAKKEDVVLIVIGVRRRSPVGKLVLGSVSQEILLHADCPVLAVKADAD
jgi:nucleotide-binding universal stress UspA family protein